MQPVQLQVDDEIKAIGDAIGGLITDIKAGKGVLQDAEDAFNALVGAVASLKNIAVDIKKVDNQAYLVYALAKALEPSV